MKKEHGSKEETILGLQSGYVIEVENKRYLWGLKKGSVYSTSIEQAKVFPTLEKAAAYAKRYLGFIGMRLYLCLACWTLVESESMEGVWQFRKGEDGHILRFFTYQEAVRCQRKEQENNSRVEFYVFREKEFFPAA